MTRVRRLIVLAVVGTTGVGLAALAAVAFTPDRTLTFVDDRSGYSMTMQTDPAAADAGHFAFRVPGLGIYVGSAGQSMRALAPTSVVVQFDGQASLRPITDATGAITGTVTAPRYVTVHLQAQIDPAHSTAEATLTESSGTFHMVAASSGRGEFLRAVVAFEMAIGTDDTTALYAIMNSDIRSRNTQAQFGEVWRAQEAQLGRITSIQRLATSDVTTDPAGVLSAIVTYTAVLTSPSGSATTRTYDAYFVHQSDGWKIWYTAAR